MRKNTMSRLNIIKTVHTLIWIFFNAVIFYLLYAVLTDQVGILVWIGVGLVLAEGVVLLSFDLQCPLTVMARKYSDSSRDNFDIFLPVWLARYTKLIYTLIFIVIIILLLYKINAGEK
jgi:hypothetical protein